MDNNCQLVVFSDKAYNAIIRETFEWEPVETGGILLGHILDNGCWIVMEVLPPGYGEGREGDNVYHEIGYFEYNQKFVNYLAKSVAEQYETPLELLGLWHRHPGSLDRFSGTDDGTNSTFAAQNPNGVISGLINVDPNLRMTMYYLSHSDALSRNIGRLNYQRVQIEVGTDLIPEHYLKLRYYQGGENDLHPLAPRRTQNRPTKSVTRTAQSPISDELTQEGENGVNMVNNPLKGQKPLSAIADFTRIIKKNARPILAFVLGVIFVFSIMEVRNDFIKLIYGCVSVKQNAVVDKRDSNPKQLNAEDKSYSLKKQNQEKKNNDTINNVENDSISKVKSL